MTYEEILVSFELIIKEKYPFLDYVLKNRESIANMKDFCTIIIFCNDLAS
jgi:hypothetical protein